MKRLLTVLAFTFLTAVAVAAEDVVVENAWIREAPPGARMMAAYLVIRNPADKAIELIAVDSPAFAHVMMHKSETVDGVARMIHQDSIVIPAGGSVALEPGSFHLMMPAPETRLTAGDSVELRLHFADERCVPVTAVVKKKP